MNRKDRRAARSKAGPRNGPAPRPAIRPLLEEGIARHRTGDLAGAAAAYRKILTIQRDNADALNLLGLTHYQRGEHGQAHDLMAQALDIAPANASFHNNIGIVLRELRRDDEAVEHFRRAITLDAANMDARINLGKALHQLCRTDEAVSAFSDVLGRAPKIAEAHAGLALALSDRGDLTEAGSHFRQAAAIEPRNALHQYNLGNYFYGIDDIPAAIAALRTAVTLDPQFADAHSQLGGVLRRDNRPNDAVAALNTALRLDPGSAAAWTSLSHALGDLRQLDKARDAALEAIRLDPTLAEAHNQLGIVLRCLGRYDEAHAAFDRAQALDPDHPFAAANRAFVHLAEGRFAEGWRDYRLRKSILRWQGRLFQDTLPDDLSGKRILVLRDQGLGDQIFFLRFIARLKQRGAHITYRGERKLLSIIARIPEIDTVIDEAEAEALPDCDYCVSAGDLPYVTGMARVEDVPPPLALSPGENMAAEMRASLAEFGPPPYVGVTWRAGVQAHNQLSKVAPPDAMARAMTGIPGTVVALQRNPEPGEIDRFAEGLGRPVCDRTALNEELEAMLALLGQIDDYVCVSNTNVHLRAGLGRTSRVLVPFPADYRWMNDGDESPWFPGTRVYRETPADGWERALATLSADLAAAFPG